MKKYLTAFLVTVYVFLSMNVVLAATYSQADLTGTWNFNLLRTGAENMWMRAQFSINSSGGVTCVSMSDSGGGTTCPEGFDLTCTMNETTGVITQSGDHAANAGTDHITMTSNKNFAAGTSTTGDDPNYKYQLVIMQKVVPETTYSNADLQNKDFVWHELYIGRNTGWNYAIGKIDDSREVILQSEIDSCCGEEEVLDPPEYTDVFLSVDNAGVVTMSGTGVGDVKKATFKGFLSADKKTIVVVYHDDPESEGGAGSEYSLKIIQITGQIYTAGPLPAGTSVAHTLAASGTYGDFWIHYTNTVDSSGILHFSDWVSSDAGVIAPETTMIGYVDASGTVTIDGNPTYHGQVSDDRTFTVGTQTMGLGSPFLWYGLNVTTTVPSTNLYGSFGGAGIWEWNGSSWNQLTASNPAMMVALGTNLYGTFGSNGIWEWNGSAWNQLTASNPEAIVVSGTTLYGDFGGNGVWKWESSSWNQLTASNPTSMVASGTSLYGTFGSNGIWQWNGSAWSQLTPSNPEAIVASGSTLYGDFGEGGIWQWTGSSWDQISASNPVNMVTGN